MAKGQKRSNREIKKPKGTTKPEAGLAPTSIRPPVKPLPSKGAGK